MKIATGLLLVISACGIAYAARAGEADPTPPTTTPAATQATPPAPQSTDTADKKKVNKIVLIDNVVNDQQLKQILAMGYRPEGHGDQVLYCRSEAEVGTRFKTKTCRSSIRILQDEAAGKDLTKTAQKDLGNEPGK